MCPNLFSKKVTGTVVTFSRAGMDDVTVEATRDDLPFSVSFNPKEKTVYIEFAPKKARRETLEKET